MMRQPVIVDGLYVTEDVAYTPEEWRKVLRDRAYQRRRYAAMTPEQRAARLAYLRSYRATHRAEIRAYKRAWARRRSA